MKNNNVPGLSGSGKKNNFGNGASNDPLTRKKSLEAKLEAQRNSPVLNLQDCCIGDEGCQILANFLQKYTAVTDIELRGNSIGSDGI